MIARHFSKLAPLLALVAFGSASARAQSTYAIPWRDIPASRCTVLVEPAFARGSIITLRCAGRLDVFLAHLSTEGQAR
ncbi:hypothetical protein ACVWZK_005507 [Bradyrhizobium sp. GM0.4]